jgi:hypothetical protein
VLSRLFSQKAGEPATFDMVVRGRPIEIAVRRNAAARRITLRVKNPTGQVVLTLPKRVPLVHGRSFALRQVDWIADRLQSVPEAVPFARGKIIPLRGVPHRLVWRGVRGVTRNVGHEPGRVRVVGEGGALARQLARYLRRREIICSGDPASSRCRLDGDDLASLIVTAGGARAAEDAPSDLIEAEDQARAERAGLWQRER